MPLLFSWSENPAKPPHLRFWIKKVIFGNISSGPFLILHSFLTNRYAPGLWSSFFSRTFALYPSMLQYGVNFVYLKFLLCIISEWAGGELRGTKAWCHPPPLLFWWGLCWIKILGLVKTIFWVWNVLNLKKEPSLRLIVEFGFIHLTRGRP